MKRKKIQKLITTVLTVAFFTNSMSALAFGVTKEDSKGIYSGLFQSLNEESVNSKEQSEVISKDIDTTSSEMVSVIVEFVSDPLAVSDGNSRTSYSLAENKVDRDHRLFDKYLAKGASTFSAEGEGPKIIYSYKTVFNGVSLTIKGTEVKNLLNSGVVKRIHPNTEVTVGPTIEEVAPAAEDNEISPFMMDSLPKLGIDDLHEEGINGTGIKVGVLDTGIDYNHPDLISAYSGFRASYGDSKNQDINTTIGWDFIDDDADPMETTYEDWLASGQPEYDGGNNVYYTSHGTHVSGTIAGTGENKNAEFPVLGVAPKVELYGYRVLGKYGSGPTDGIIAAVEKSVKDGMDVINMSLGGGGETGPFDPMVAAVNNASKAGVVTVISNGNAGPNSYTVGSPGTAQLPIAVGASTVDVKVHNYGLAIGDLDLNSVLVGPSYNYSITELLDQEMEVVYCALGYEKDFEGKDLTGKIAFVDRGIITFLEKAQNAAAAGAEVVIIANNTTANAIPALGEGIGANILAITQEQGNALKEVLDSKMTLKDNGATVLEGDEVTGFSSVGPVNQTYEIRPDVVAPGSMVYSAAPEYINDKNPDVEDYTVAYQRMSGTSMAAPHIAGIAALILQNNPEYTPEDVKNAIMNTSEHLHQKSGVSYSVHETGAGRVNAFEAVHENVRFSAEYETFAGDDREALDNITGMLSFGKMMISEEGEVSKTIPVTVTNNSDTAKKYAINIEYSDSSRAKDAVKNGVKVVLPSEITVAPGTSEKFDVTISSPNAIEFGTYEGFIHFTEAGDKENTYQMPFSATILKPGFAVLTYPALGEGEGTAKGITGFTSSNLYNRHPATLFTLPDIAVVVQVNEAIKYIETYAVDPETKERIGYGGKQDASWFPMGANIAVENFFANGKAKKIVNGKVSHEEFPLATGIYELEVVATDYDGKTFAESIPMGIINDNSYDQISFNMKEGVIEVTDDSYTKETWYDGNEYEGLWLKVEAYNEIVEKMKNEYGLDFLKQEELNVVYAEGTGRTGSTFQMETMIKEDGKVVVAGVERSDLDKGLFRVNLSHINPGKTTSKPTSFTFVNEGSSYLSLSTATEKISKGSVLNTAITLNNGQNVAKGSFSIKSQGQVNFKDAKITPSAELKALVGEKNIVTNITFNKVEDQWESYEQFDISFDLTSAGADFKGLTGDIKLFDITYDVDSIDGIDESLMDNANFMYTTLKGMDGEFKDVKDNVVDVMAGTIFETIDLEYPDRTLIYGNTSTPWSGMKDANIYAVDPSGNKYEPTYLLLDEDGRNHSFAFNNLPVIDGDYKVILETPGCFDSIMNVPGSILNKDNKRVGNTFAITSYSFVAPPMVAYAGDVNGDGAIDIVDASEMAKVYEEGTPHWFSLGGEEKPLVTDITQDGVVNYFDMLLLLSNYMMQDLSNKDSKIPEETIEGRDIIDILESCGYYDEGYEDGIERNVKLEMDKEKSFVGDEVTFEAIPPTEEVNFEYEFAVREKNDKDWTVIQEKSLARSTTWKSSTAGEYEFKVRIFLDNIEYVCQDNKFHTVSWQELKGITLDKETLDLKTGSEDKLEVSLNPWNARPQEFVWTSSDEGVATVIDGKVMTKKAGTATITVKTVSGDFSAQCKVKVTDVALESISLNKEKLELNKGEEANLEVTFNPENATNKKVTWASADEKIASVKEGKVVGVNPGTTVVTVTSADGKLSDTCIVTVNEKELPPTKPVAEKITLNNHDAKLKVGEKLTLKAKVTPAEAVMPELIWASSDEKVATVKDGVVTAIGEGKVTITVKSKDGKLSDTCNIVVSKEGSGSNLPQTGAIGIAVGNSGLLASAGLMTLVMSTLIAVGKKKEDKEE